MSRPLQLYDLFLLFFSLALPLWIMTKLESYSAVTTENSFIQINLEILFLQTFRPWHLHRIFFFFQNFKPWKTRKITFSKSNYVYTISLTFQSPLLHTGAKILNLSKNPHIESHISQNSQFRNLIFTKFTISKYHSSQNSQFQGLIFHKIHIFKHKIPRNFWIKGLLMPQCVSVHYVQTVGF